MDRRSFIAAIPLAVAIPACTHTRSVTAVPKPHSRNLAELNAATEGWFPHLIPSPFEKGQDNLYFSVIDTADGRQYVTYSSGWLSEMDTTLFLHRWIAVPTVTEYYARDWKMWYSAIQVSQEELVYGEQTYGGLAGGIFHAGDRLRRPLLVAAYSYPRSIHQLLLKSHDEMVYNIQHKVESW